MPGPKELRAVMASSPHCYGQAHLTNYAELRASKTVDCGLCKRSGLTEGGGHPQTSVVSLINPFQWQTDAELQLHGEKKERSGKNI